MKLYPNLSVEVKMVDHGSSWQIVIRGIEREVEWVFNAFYNFCATDYGNALTWNEIRSEAAFFSTKSKITRFFALFWENRNLNQGLDEVAARKGLFLKARNSVADLFNLHREKKVQYKSLGGDFARNGYSIGAARDAKPDDDFKDAAFKNADKIGMGAKKVSETSEELS